MRYFRHNRSRFLWCLRVLAAILVLGGCLFGESSAVYATVESDAGGVRVPPPEGKASWRYIVIHHSATTGGNAGIFDRYHRQVKHMENGLAYHFVITNGKGGKDGAIQTGKRWKSQLAGGHTANAAMNRIGIGICLVGNFQRHKPTAKQMTSLCALVGQLQAKYGVPDWRVITHRQVHQKKGTQCPGKWFSEKRFLKMIKAQRKNHARSG